jgi:cholesterol oxidase
MSRSLRRLRPHYTAVVVGSGYGGGIAASRLRRAGHSVCVLERGREIHPGSYPTNPVNGIPQLQATTPFGHAGSHTALFDFRFHLDMSVLIGCGLGGTSLINAGVAERATPGVFADRWPAELHNGLAVLEPFYRRAEHWLGSTPLPARDQLAKLDALGRMGASLGQPAERPAINVTFTNGPNAAGIDQKACTLCGDCVSGCNGASKNSVLMNYIADAHLHDAEIFTEVEVRTIRREGERWVVAFRPAAGRAFESRGYETTQFVKADIVVLAAGTLGTTEILLRSRENEHLKLSPLLGERFSANGDVLGIAYDVDQPVHGMGAGKNKAGFVAPGPCITGIIDLRHEPDPKKSMVIEEGVVPSPLRSLMPLGLALGATFIARDTQGGARGVWRRVREFGSALLGPFAGATDRTMVLLVMSTDDSGGTIEFDADRDRAEVKWSGIGSGGPFPLDNERLRWATEALRGTYIPNPIWTSRFGRSLITVQPLGGCVMGSDRENGVVNHRGQVFDAGATSTTAVHQGLLITDGSIIPTALAVNPSLTISALAERACELLCNEIGSNITWN